MENSSAAFEGSRRPASLAVMHTLGLVSRLLRSRPLMLAWKMMR